MCRYNFAAAGPRGVFPNEVYRDIIGHVDPDTRLASLAVSRAFRDFASEKFAVDENISLEFLPGDLEPRCIHIMAGDLGPFHLSNPAKNSTRVQWHPVVGHLDGTSSFIPQLSLAFAVVIYNGAQSLNQEYTREKEEAPRLAYVSSADADREYERVFYGSRRRIDGSAPPIHNYAIFERCLPSQDTIASSGDVMCLYSAVFFFPLSVFGCTPELRRDHWRFKDRESIGVVPSNVCMYLGTRMSKLGYGLAW
jgi:hypothetical protein